MPPNALKKYIDSIEPLPFATMHTNKYLESVMNFQSAHYVRDEMEHYYEEQKLKGDRIRDMMVLGSSIDLDEEEYLDDLFSNPEEEG